MKKCIKHKLTFVSWNAERLPSLPIQADLGRKILMWYVIFTLVLSCLSMLNANLS